MALSLDGARRTGKIRCPRSLMSWAASRTIFSLIACGWPDRSLCRSSDESAGGERGPNQSVFPPCGWIRIQCPGPHTAHREALQQGRFRHHASLKVPDLDDAARALALSIAPDLSASRIVLPCGAGAGESNTESWVQGFRIRNAAAPRPARQSDVHACGPDWLARKRKCDVAAVHGRSCGLRPTFASRCVDDDILPTA